MLQIISMALSSQLEQPVFMMAGCRLLLYGKKRGHAASDADDVTFTSNDAAPLQTRPSNYGTLIS